MAITQSLEDAHASTEVQSSIQMISERDGMAEDDDDDDKVKFGMPFHTLHMAATSHKAV